MYGREASIRLSPGMSTPRSRGIRREVGRLTLPLLVAGIRAADNADDVLALHDAAGLAKALHRGSYFHGSVVGLNWVSEKLATPSLEDKKSHRSTLPARQCDLKPLA